MAVNITSAYVQNATATAQRAIISDELTQTINDNITAEAELGNFIYTYNAKLYPEIVLAFQNANFVVTEELRGDVTVTIFDWSNAQTT